MRILAGGSFGLVMGVAACGSHSSVQGRTETNDGSAVDQASFPADASNDDTEGGTCGLAGQPDHPPTPVCGASACGNGLRDSCTVCSPEPVVGPGAAGTAGGTAEDAGCALLGDVANVATERGFRSTLEDRARGRGHRRMTGASTRVCIEKPVGRHTSPFPPRERIVLACVVSTAWTSPPAAHGAHACARVHAAIGLRA